MYVGVVNSLYLSKWHFHNDHAAKECILVVRMIKSAGWEAPGGGQLW